MRFLSDVLLDEELADTIDDARRRRGDPPMSKRERHLEVSRTSQKRPPASRSETRRLTRDLVGHHTPPRLGVCGFCGAPAPHRTVCDAHSDLPQLDPSTGVHVTTATATRSSR